MGGGFPCGCRKTSTIGCCEIVTDDFNRADSTSVGANYTEETGNWQILSNVLRASGGFLGTCTLRVDDPVHNCTDPLLYVAEASVWADTENGVAKIYFGTSSDVGSVSLTFRAGANNATFSVVGQNCQVTAELSTWHTIKICWNNKGLVGGWFDGTLMAAGSFNNWPTVAGAFGAGNNGLTLSAAPQTGGAVQFDDLKYAIGEDESGGYCDCLDGCCWPHDVRQPTQIKVTAANYVSDAGSTCADCANINADYFLPLVDCGGGGFACLTTSGRAICCYRLAVDPATSPCGLSSVEVVIGVGSPLSGCSVSVALAMSAGCDTYTFAANMDITCQSSSLSANLGSGLACTRDFASPPITLTLTPVF